MFRKGFTLVEVIVSLSIIAILLSLLVINFNLGSSYTNLNNSQASIYHNIRLAQSYALSHRSYYDHLPVYWGLNFKKGDAFFQLFADLDGDYRLGLNEADQNGGGKKISLASNIFINYLSWDFNEINILFELGTGKMILYIVDLDETLETKPYQIELRDERYNRIGRSIIVQVQRFIKLGNCDCDNAEDYCCKFCMSSSPCINIEN
ncbi:MAG: pilus assembly FimT family protein [Patescibacteria group bacterium]|jgi:prepilin-type N-terminal cleavage/methylation domain-containing protein